MSDIALTNYPASGDEGALRTVLFGVPSNRVVVMIEIFEGEEGEDSYALTIGNGPTNPEIPEFLSDVSELLKAISDSGAVVIVEELERLSDETTPPVD